MRKVAFNFSNCVLFRILQVSYISIGLTSREDGEKRINHKPSGTVKSPPRLPRWRKSCCYMKT